VDAIAATKMITQMLRADSIAYIVRPVANYDEMKLEVEKNLTSDTDIKSVFLINCGAVSVNIFFIFLSTITNSSFYNHRFTIFQSALVLNRVEIGDAS